MDKDNSLLIIEENDIVQQKTQEEKEEIDQASRLKLAMRNKKLKDDFLRANSPLDEYDDEIEKSIMDMEKSVGEQVTSESESETDNEDGVNKEQSRLIEAHILKKNFYDHLLLPFHERRRLSQCKEESESDDEAGGSTTKAPKIIITPTSETETVREVVKQTRFIVTRTKEDTPAPIATIEEVAPTETKPVSILKKSPSPPDQKKLLTNSPKKIRIEAGALLKNVTSEKNSNTIHFPSSTGVSQRTNVKNFFTDVLNPHLDRRYFDSSLVEIRASQQTLSDSLKALNDSSSTPVHIVDDVWVKRPDGSSKKPAVQNVNLSSESVQGSLKSVSVSLADGAFI